MKIGGATGLEAPRPAAREVEPQRTPVTREQLRGAIARALERTQGARPDPALVDVLTAHASLETASGARMYNYNFGGIKGRAPSGGTAVCKTHEVIGGREVAIRDGFRAYRSLDEGALDYVKLMQGRFGAALPAAARGDIAGFAHALKKAGYYTAAEADYARGLAALAGRSAGAPGPAHAPPVGLAPTSEGVLRVTDALDAERWLSSLGPSPRRARAADEEDEG